MTDSSKINFLISELHRYIKEYNKNPSFNKLCKDKSYPGVTQFVKTFGNWNNALKAAGIELFEINKTENTECIYCKNIFVKKKKDPKKFCNRSCAAKHNNKFRLPRTIEQRLNTSRAIREYNSKNKNKEITFNRVYFRQCKGCETYFYNRQRKHCKYCSDICRSKAFINAGKKSASLRQKRSKKEIQLYELCKQHFKNVEHNIMLVDNWDADIVLTDHKIAILWNGAWHYREMPGLNHSLKQVQNRDNIKRKLFIRNGWRVLFLEDRYYTVDSALNFIIKYVDCTLQF